MEKIKIITDLASFELEGEFEIHDEVNEAWVAFDASDSDSFKQPVWEWLAKIYDFRGDTQPSFRKEHAATVILGGKFELLDAWPRSVNFNDLDLSHEEQTIEIVLRYREYKPCLGGVEVKALPPSHEDILIKFGRAKSHQHEVQTQKRRDWIKAKDDIRRKREEERKKREAEQKKKKK